MLVDSLKLKSFFMTIQPFFGGIRSAFLVMVTKIAVSTEK